MKKLKSICLSILFLVYMVTLFRITVFRSGFSLSHFMQNGTINLTLFQDYIPLIQLGRWFRFLYLFVGNIIWFVPFGGALFAFRQKKRIWEAALCGFLLSLFIETMQYIFGTGISELDDLILNTLGAVAGALMVRVYGYLRHRRNG